MTHKLQHSSASETLKARNAAAASLDRICAGDSYAVSTVAQAKHYLHLYAFPCGKCNGPVIVGSIGRREDNISQETGVGEIGAVCIACGRLPERMLSPLAGHCFRPVEWSWPIQKRPPSEDLNGDSLAAELSQDADK